MKLFHCTRSGGEKCLFFASGLGPSRRSTACAVAALFGRFAGWGRTDILGSES